MEFAFALVALVAAVAVGGLVVVWRRTTAPPPEPAPPEPARLADDEVARIVAQLRAELSDTQASALRHNTEQFLALAEQRLREESSLGEARLKARQAEIDQGLRALTEQLGAVKDYVERTDRQRGDSILQLQTVVQQSHRSVRELAAVTQGLNQALTSGQQRGQWGERMADDILRASGLIEDVNYRRNKSLDGGSGRPDFTFLLPQDRVLHMDVKFPLAGYLRYLDAESDADRDTARKQFLADVRRRLREVTTRDYIDTTANTLDYVLVFIPNEQVYGFIHEHDPAVLDEALRMRVVLCSPITLFAVLAVVRQAMENFRLSEQTDRILAALGGFAKQWGKYQDAVQKVGTRIESAQRAYDELAGTRTNQLQRQVGKVEALRLEAGVEADASEDEAAEEPAAAEIPRHLLAGG